MSTLNISDLSFMTVVEDIEQLQKGGFWGGFWGGIKIGQDIDSGVKFYQSGKVNQGIIVNSSANNVGGPQVITTVVSANLIVGSGSQDIDNGLGIGVDA